MRCPRCQHENPAGVKFCGECGAGLEVLCPACRVANPPTNKFCHQCGGPLTGGASRPKFASPEAYTPKHLIQAARGDVLQAQQLYRDTSARATDLGMRPLVAHCHFGLGKLYRPTGKRQEALDALNTAATMYREMDMGFWLEQAEAELKMLG